MSQRVKITGWESGFNKVEMSRLIRSSTELGLADSKQSVDSILEGNSVILVLNCKSDVEIFLKTARGLGAVCSAF